MLSKLIARTVGISVVYATYVFVIAAVISLASGYYAVRHFAISTDINKLISSDLPWIKRQEALNQVFPAQNNFTLAVVDAPTSELATEANTALLAELHRHPQLYRSIQQKGGGDFFAHNGLLFQPLDQLKQTAENLEGAGALLNTLTTDPSIRGLGSALDLVLVGVNRGRVTLDQTVRPFGMFADAIEKVLADKPAYFSWQEMLKGVPPTQQDLTRLIEIQPVLDYTALEPGKAASDAIRKAAADAGLAQKYDARVRLTGGVPIADEEFATVREGALVNGIGTVVIVLGILWLALKSGRIILAVFINLVVGLLITAALGLMMVGALNMISVAFAVLFVGLGVDFGIQFAVRYRAERYELKDLRASLIQAGRRVGPPLTLAAAAVATGFLSFLPTAYRGVSELGQIAGTGMIVAFITSITLLPALISVFKPRGEEGEIGYRALAPIDNFLDKHRIPVLAGTALVVLAGIPLLFHLHFDFNPMHLRSAKVESIATYLDLQKDPQASSNPIDVLAASQSDAAAIAARLSKVPEVGRVVTVSTFVPDQQDQKLPIVRHLVETIGPDLSDPESAPPSDAENIDALKEAADGLNGAAEGNTGPGAEMAKRLAGDLTRLAAADPAKRQRTEAALIPPLKVSLQQLKDLLKAEAVSIETLPPDIVHDWIASNGRERVATYPKGNANDTEVIRQFARAVLAVQPDAIGGPISILESGNTIVAAFIQAGLWAIAAIAIILFIVLRRITDVLMTLIPLLVAGVLTLELTVLIGLPLNFANIIAIPLMLGLGVAFKIYYIMAWRAGQTNLLQTSLTRAVIFSAMTTVTAFGSLYLSSHPGTSSMGELLIVSLCCTLAAAVLFQPALMGRPRTTAEQ